MKDQDFMKSQFKRKRLIVSYSSQGRVVAYSLIIHTIVIGFLYFVTNRALMTLLDPGSGLMPSGQEYIEYGKNLKNYLDMAFLIAFVASLFGLFLTQSVLANRLVGPVYRMTEVVRKINEGEAYNPGSLKLRKNDFFAELADQIAKLLSKK